MFQQNSIFEARGVKFECNVYYDSILKFMKNDFQKIVQKMPPPLTSLIIPLCDPTYTNFSWAKIQS